MEMAEQSGQVIAEQSTTTLMYEAAQKKQKLKGLSILLRLYLNK
jgi:hypothetical protein